MSVEAVDYCGASRLIGTDHFAELFGIETFGEGGRAHEVTEHHGELAPLGATGGRPLPNSSQT